ncbi:PIG-L family deacetylase [Arthrobacter sp. H14-L1]|uniref:PIG-L family deacetylase n=1 Tax=Arthrobacter sp. H14-L1 TaxID=2996697 RepID=UPI002271B13B|nr:PIG-L family deacetylase [Arthrobacter sp. H14-L1]MCY0903571.1 PIG-L family deacetylase [Arthrobacter sp. H14-L1]
MGASVYPIFEGSPAGSSLSFVAHQDDDLFFQNPDLSDWIAAGRPHRTVYLTAGENNGLPDRTREQYARDRQAGERAAYAQMAGLPDNWQRRALPVSGRAVELATLIGSVSPVELVFLCLPDGGDQNHLQALTNLFNGSYATVPTIVPDDSPVGLSCTYTREALVGMLTSLMDMFQPTIIRAQDPLPDELGRLEHADHVAAARFVGEAVNGYNGPGGNHHALLINYRCYSIEDSQSNLTVEASAGKASVFSTYQQSDPLAQDLGWTASMYYRWPPGNAWIGRDPQGRSWAFAVQNNQVLAWHQDSGDQPWSGPEGIGGGPISPCLTVGTNADGRLQVFGLRLDTHDITTAYQTGPDLAFSAWLTLGNADGAAAGGATGVPAASNNQDGTLVLFSRNARGGMSITSQTVPNGSFGEWQDLPDGSGLLNECSSPVLTADDRIELFAGSNSGIAHWYQHLPNGPLRYDPQFPSSAPAGAPQAIRDSADLLKVYYRRPVDGTLLASVQSVVDGSWLPVVMNLGGPAGQGQPTAAPDSRTKQCLFLAARTATGSVVVVSAADVTGLAPQWVELPSNIIGLPACLAQTDGTLTLFGIGTDGRLQQYLGWTAVGS